MKLEFETLPDWLSYLEQLHPKTIELGLERVEKVKREMQLEPGFPIITVSGTNGKGSTCAMLEAILSDAGFRVGCYTSPHLLRYNERVRVGREDASDAELCNAFAAVEQARNKISLTYFEFGTLAAVRHFVQQEVDVAILEVGLGGRLDAVNVFDSDCAIISSIDMDHMDYLGDTREAIGLEKAGIVRAGKPVICAEPDLPVVVEKFIGTIGARLYQIGRDFGFTQLDTQWRFDGPRGSRHALPYPVLRGKFQLANASACLTALDELKSQLPVTVNNIRNGLLDTRLSGRFQVRPGRPVVVLDVAHNPHAAKALAVNLQNMPCTGKTIAVFAMLGDKDIVGVINEVKAQVNTWLLADIKEMRGATAQHLLQVIRKEIGDVVAEEYESVGIAYRRACILASENDRIIIFGSFHTVADALRELHLT
ncbi:bifunctional tetrahydrofolate synthase/dihydrofolate synthase [Sulfurirhabdus autotrophica]|uniref:Dihydrofolate synthase/folylpolyglutamate synthase n=1 Tax=Sulfurirhabdus autotrophica TaxID=1706046 RepID=A0A4R3YEH3_9PROT|nr:bifunctional tetrahydrofolate synthase/dihydrofolate synthase [Sulfurirhabdus autotrophica]TCV90470.1 dihydrofolate synthase/folylpolyglutamate synthase [Sulfurirhabdus autotrophica]